MRRKKLLIINCSPVRDGATAEIIRTVQQLLEGSFDLRAVCIDDYSIALCKGCRSCHSTAECVQRDGAQQLLAEMSLSDVILCVSPSYWADVPGQFKVFIDRCTPWCNTHEPCATIGRGKNGYCIALRTGPGIKECERIHDTLRHFFGHLEIESRGALSLTRVEGKADAEAKNGEIQAFCRMVAAQEAL